MTKSAKTCALALGLVLACGLAFGQKKKPAPAKTKAKTEQSQPAKKTPPKEVSAEQKPSVTDAENEKKVRDIVAFLEYLLNTLGSAATSTRDKEVVIRESYSKIFIDDKVQIEDDLENREVVTNKNVVAYLKDVDFFFTDVRFTFDIESIEGGGTDNNKVFYKVALQRNLKGTTLEGEQVNNTLPRFIEVNYDPDTDGLKIASMYTKGFDEKVALTTWWNDLTLEWKAVFKRKLNLTADSLSFEEIKKVAAIDSLDLTNNLYIRSLQPLTQLSHLHYLNLTATTISDLTPIRNLTTLVDLSVHGTAVKDLQPMRYAAAMRRLNISESSVESLEAIQKMPLLQSLDASHSNVADVSFLAGLTELQTLSLRRTPVYDLAGLSQLQNLEHLDLSGTGVTDLTPLSSMQKIVTLNIDSTKVRDLRPLSNMQALHELSANSSRIDNIEPLKSLSSLKRIYCDQTQIVRSVAESFMASRPGVLVVYDSKDLKSWWEGLSQEWRNVLMPGVVNPSKDDLALLTSLDTISLKGNSSIKSLEPLKRMTKLRKINIAETAITDLTPIRDLKEVAEIDISHTDVTDLGPLRFWKKLTVLKANATRIQNIDPLVSQTALKKLYVDETGIHDVHAQEFLARNTGCLLVYKTFHAERWWTRLSTEWKTFFESQLKTSTPDTEDLHALLETKSLVVNDAPVTELGTLTEFVQLEELRFSGTSVQDLSPLTALNKLRILHATNSPVGELEPAGSMATLEVLDVSGTPVDDLRALRRLNKLKKFSCAGTQVRKLDPLGDLPVLEYIDCSNTSVAQLDAIEKLPLKTLKCFNTRVSKREVDRLRERGVDVVYYK
jgi:Leucine-rich repeat (LRR) protein